MAIKNKSIADALAAYVAKRAESTSGKAAAALADDARDYIEALSTASPPVQFNAEGISIKRDGAVFYEGVALTTVGAQVRTLAALKARLETTRTVEDLERLTAALAAAIAV